MCVVKVWCSDGVESGLRAMGLGGALPWSLEAGLRCTPGFHGGKGKPTSLTGRGLDVLELPVPVVLIPAAFAPGLAGNSCIRAISAEQFRHWPFSFLCCRAFFPCSRAASFRSAVWFLACSYKRRASRCSSGVLLGFGSFRGFSFLGPGFLTFLALLGFWLGSGPVSSKRCWKVLSSVRGWGLECTVGGTIFEMWLGAL